MTDALVDACPDAVSNSTLYDSLVANVPYRTSDSESVFVDPVMPSNEFGVLVSQPIKDDTIDVLTTADGRKPNIQDSSMLVGWELDPERDRINKLVSSAQGLKTVADAQGFHPQVNSAVSRLTASALNDLLEIEQIYAVWDRAQMLAEPNDSPFSYYQMNNGFGPIGLDAEWFEIRQWMRKPRSKDVEQWFQTYSPQLQGEGMFEPREADGFMRAMLRSRRKSRLRILQRLHFAARKVQCAEYGAAQSTSFFKNKKNFFDGPARFGEFGFRSTPIDDSQDEGPGASFGFETVDDVPPDPGREDPIPIPPVSTGLPLPVEPTSKPEISLPIVAGVGLIAGYFLLR